MLFPGSSVGLSLGCSPLGTECSGVGPLRVPDWDEKHFHYGYFLPQKDNHVSRMYYLGQMSFPEQWHEVDRLFLTV